jgi:hypothetical protein
MNIGKITGAFDPAIGRIFFNCAFISSRGIGIGY